MLLEFNQIGKSYFGKNVLNDISFRVNAGARIGLIGRNGSGKSTLLKIAEGLESPDTGSVTRPAGTLTGYLSQDMDTLGEGDQSPLFSHELSELETLMRGLEKRLAHAPSDTDRAHLDLLASYSAATARFEALGGYDYEHVMRQTLDGLGLVGEALDRPIASLSGGERMRVRLAKILLRSPDLLFLDEPTNHLDLGALEWLEGYLSRFSGAVVIVSHDRMFLDRTVNAIAELSAGHIHIRPGNYSEYQAQKQLEEETRSREIKRLEKERDRQQGVVQTMLSHRKMSAYHSREKRVAKLSDILAEKTAGTESRTSPSMRIRFVSGDKPGDSRRMLMRAEGLSMAYGDNLLFDHVDFSLRADDRIALSGPNGCGKTSLMRILLGKEQAVDGQLWLSGVAKIGYMGQFVDFSDETHTVFQEAADATRQTDGHIRSLLARFGFRDIDLLKKISVLSGGERSRLFLCLMLEDHADVLLLDEPTNHLDIESREILEDALLNYTGAILAISHDRYFVEKCCTSILGFVGKDIRPFYSYDDYRTATTLQNRETVESTRQAARQKQADRMDREADAGKPDRVNRAQARREVAARRERLRLLESSIQQMEEDRTRMESAFHTSTPPETYHEYAEIVEQIEKAYEEFLVLSDED